MAGIQRNMQLVLHAQGDFWVSISWVAAAISYSKLFETEETFLNPLDYGMVVCCSVKNSKKKKKNLEHANIFQITVILELQIIPEYRACDQVYISPPNLKHISEKNLFIIIVQKHTEKYVFVSKILNSL